MRDEQDKRSEQDEDVEAHVVRSGRAPAEAADVQAHALKARGRGDEGPPPQETERDLGRPDADDDVEGHLARGRY